MGRAREGRSTKAGACVNGTGEQKEMNDAIFGGNWQDAKSKPPGLVREDSSSEELSSEEEGDEMDDEEMGAFHEPKSQPEVLRF